MLSNTLLVISSLCTVIVLILVIQIVWDFLREEERDRIDRRIAARFGNWDTAALLKLEEDIRNLKYPSVTITGTSSSSSIPAYQYHTAGEPLTCAIKKKRSKRKHK